MTTPSNKPSQGEDTTSRPVSSTFLRDAGAAFTGGVAAVAIGVTFAAPWMADNFDQQNARLTEIEGQINGLLTAEEFRISLDGLKEDMARQQARLDKFFGESSGYINEIFPFEFVSDLERANRARFLKVTRFDDEYWIFIGREELSRFTIAEQEQLQRSIELHDVRLVIEDD